MPTTYGYYRVSTRDQNPALQIQALKKAGCSEIQGDVGVSGAKASRPAFDKIISKLKAGDKLMVWRLDRMGRSLRHLIEINQLLSERGAAFESLTEKIDTTTAMGEFVFHILAAVAQLEREIIRERTIAGLEVAAINGRRPGRPRSMSSDEVHLARRRISRQSHSIRQVAEGLGVSAATVRRRIAI
jgi:DNA invertase Pin-like site-specific DNA recombinase